MAELLPCVAPTRAEIRAARVAKAKAKAKAKELKRALDADAHPHVFGGAATVAKGGTVKLSINTRALACSLEKAVAKLPPVRRCKHLRARSIVCMVPSPLGLTDMPISTFRTDGYVVKWCPACGALQNKHPKRFGLQTRVMWRRPQNGDQR